MTESGYPRKCSAYMDRDECIGSACLWFDAKTHNCFIQNPTQQPQRSWKKKSRLERAGKRQAIYNIIHRLHELKMRQLMDEAEKEKIDGKELREILNELEDKGLVYNPKPGVIGCVD